MASICDVPGCGRELPPQVGPGRPRKRCETCKPPSPARRGPGEPPPTAGPRLTVVNLPRTSPKLDEPDPKPDEPELNLAQTVERELRRAGRLSTPLGKAALLVAVRLHSAEDASKLAALTKEFRATLAAALDGAQAEEDELDAIRKRYGRAGA